MAIARTLLIYAGGFAMGWLARGNNVRTRNAAAIGATTPARATPDGAKDLASATFGRAAFAPASFAPPVGLSTIDQLSGYWDASEQAISNSIGCVYLKYGGDVGSAECQAILAPLQSGYSTLSDSMQQTLARLTQVVSAVDHLHRISDGMNQTAQEMKQGTNLLLKAQKLFSDANSILKLA